MTPKEVVEKVKKEGVEFIDLKFIDFPGVWQHFSIPAGELNEDSFSEGVGFDGSSIRGWQAINASDMLVMPDPDTAFLDPFTARKTLNLICNVVDPVTRMEYSRDPRNIARKAEKYLRSTGIADTSYFGPELEFFIFDSARFETSYNYGFYYIDSIAGRWNSGKDEPGGNQAYKPRYKEGYFPVAPTDKFQDLRSEMVTEMLKAGMRIEAHHHEVATAGQSEIDMGFNSLVKMGDSVMRYKYLIKNIAYRAGKTVTFMPKPLFQDNGSGMHTHFSLWKEGKPLFYGNGYANLSETALYAIGGILTHAHSILAFAAPTTNSYKRLVPGYEAPVNLAYSSRNRSAAVRIPVYSPSPKAKRVEFRCPDPSSNPYLTFCTILMAALDGIQKKIHPGEPMDKDLYDLEPEEKAKIKTTPASLEESLKALEKDHEYLLRGDVFTEDVLSTWIEYKRLKEADQIRLRPHPHEFELYFDI
ncbi:MAG: type I glutamate--ammonia ligase [Planctomycetes bacterium]|nr:type I glutamate--ammonia ligase [Planctomycetota bacterium]